MRFWLKNFCKYRPWSSKFENITSRVFKLWHSLARNGKFDKESFFSFKIDISFETFFGVNFSYIKFFVSILTSWVKSYTFLNFTTFLRFSVLGWHYFPKSWSKWLFFACFKLRSSWLWVEDSFEPNFRSVLHRRWEWWLRNRWSADYSWNQLETNTAESLCSSPEVNLNNHSITMNVSNV